MKKKNYSQLNYEQELARKERAEKKAAKYWLSALPALLLWDQTQIKMVLMRRERYEQK